MNRKKIFLLAAVSVSACLAQTLRPLRGEVVSAQPMDMAGLTVRLDPPGALGRGETAPVTVGGDFAFLNIPEGSYTLRLLDSRGDEILSQPLTVSSANPSISVRLPSVPSERPTGESTSVARLRHRPNRHALAAAQKAQKFSEAGAYDQAAAEWRKAVEADPEFSEAHGNLGAQYARLNRPSEAAEEFRRAIALDPATARHQSNLAVVLAQSGRFDEAESWARHAVQQESSNALGHYVLGCVLSSRTATVPEAIQQFRIAARQIPRAHQMLANIYQAQGKEALAVVEREQYQEGTQTPGRSKPNSWSSTLH